MAQNSSGGLSPSPPCAEPIAQSDSFHADLGKTLALIQSELAAIRHTLAGKRKRTYSVEEFAALLGRSPYTIRRWISTGRIRAMRAEGTGKRGRLLVPDSELDRICSEGGGAHIPDWVMG